MASGTKRGRVRDADLKADLLRVAVPHRRGFPTRQRPKPARSAGVRSTAARRTATAGLRASSMRGCAAWRGGYKRAGYADDSQGAVHLAVIRRTGVGPSRAWRATVRVRKSTDSDG